MAPLFYCHLLILALCAVRTHGSNHCYDKNGNCLASPSFVFSLPSSNSSVDTWIRDVYTSVQFCTALAGNAPSCQAAAAAPHMCAVSSTGGCMSRRDQYEPYMCLLDFLAARRAGSGSGRETLADGSPPCELAARMFAPCYNHTSQAGCQAADSCTWLPEGYLQINDVSLCVNADYLDAGSARAAALSALDSELWRLVNVKDGICAHYSAADGCTPPAIIPMYLQCGGTGGDCASYTCVDAPYPNTTCANGGGCNKQRSYYWQCLPGPTTSATDVDTTRSDFTSLILIDEDDVSTGSSAGSSTSSISARESLASRKAGGASGAATAINSSTTAAAGEALVAKVAAAASSAAAPEVAAISGALACAVAAVAAVLMAV